jgi:hypothetical protein
MKMKMTMKTQIMYLRRRCEVVVGSTLALIIVAAGSVLGAASLGDSRSLPLQNDIATASPEFAASVEASDVAPTSPEASTFGHPAFFTGEIPLPFGWYYLQFPNGTPLGYYFYFSDPHFIYHIDLGYEYVMDAYDGYNGIYFYDFASGAFCYTAPIFFPYFYDFTLDAVLYYLPGTHNPRWFLNLATGQWFPS